MASRSLFAPTVNSYEPAFLNTGSCEINFTLSKYNTSNVNSVQAIVMSVESGQNIIDKDLDQSLGFTQTGIILDLQPVYDSATGIFKVVIDKKYIRGSWQIGSLYKFQIRLSEVSYAGSAETQASWLNINANRFSEWSTVIVSKATGASSLQVPVLESVAELESSSLDLYGTYNNTDESETVYSYTVKLSSNGTELENSGTLYTNRYSNNNDIKYIFTTELQKDVAYDVDIDILTINKYQYHTLYHFVADPDEAEDVDIELKEIPLMYGYEEDEGCVALEIYSSTYTTLSNALKLCIRRTDQYSDFKTWEDICIIDLPAGTNISTLNPYYDFTIVSGVRYNYGIQQIVEEIDEHQVIKVTRSPLKIIKEATAPQRNKDIYRVFNFSYLTGENQRQLKLQFDNTISNINNNIEDAVIKTIGSKYPFINRGGESDYQTFSLSGKISFNMDDNHLFLNKDFLYGYSNNDFIEQRDFTYEREFRKEVNNFLKDGKIKLFKSPSEGNLLVRLTNISLSPETSLGRLIYNFSATVTEMDEISITNYKKYKILDNTLLSYPYSVQSAHSHTVVSETPRYV